MKRIALLIVLVAACKSSDTAVPAKTDPTPSAPAPTRTREAPALPTDQPQGSASAPGHAPWTQDRPWRKGNDRMRRMDTDGDGKISDEERAAAMKQRAETMRTRWDTNGDGKLTVDELANAKGRMQFEDPAAIDTNKDGDISADELAAAMQARRDAMKARAEGAGSAAP